MENISNTIKVGSEVIVDFNNGNPILVGVVTKLHDDGSVYILFADGSCFYLGAHSVCNEYVTVEATGNCHLEILDIFGLLASKTRSLVADVEEEENEEDN